MSEEGEPKGMPDAAREPQPARAGGTIREDPANPHRTRDRKLVLPHRAPLPALLEALERKMEAIANSKEADGIYNLLPDSHGGKLIGTDVARELLPEYRDREGKLENTSATHRVGEVYARDRLWREIGRRGNRKMLLFTAGGVAAGKSTALSPEVIGMMDLICLP